MVFIPRRWAQPNSRSMVAASNVSACHISSSLIAVLGRKLLPTSQGCDEYQRDALSAGHLPAVLSAVDLGAVDLSVIDLSVIECVTTTRNSASQRREAPLSMSILQLT